MGLCVNSGSSYLHDGSLSFLSLSMARLSLTALHPLILLSHFLFVTLAQALYLSRGVQIQLVCVILCCLVLFSDGLSGQESIWTHTCLNTHLHTHLMFSDSHYSFEALPYCLHLTERGWWWCEGVVVAPWSTIQAPWNGFHFDDQWHSIRKCHGTRGLSLNLQLLD